MQINDIGYVIKALKYGENSAIVTIISQHNGKVVGFVKNAFSKKKANIFELGNLLEFEANSRLEDNMPLLRAELIKPNTIYFMTSHERLKVLCQMANLLNICLPEKQDIERLYFHIDSFFNFIENDNWLVYYAFFEFYLLEFLGIGIDLSSCADTNTTDDLTYVSPKSARAVCAISGLPYKDRLFCYPHFIRANHYSPTQAELQDCLKMTEFFLKENFFKA